MTMTLSPVSMCGVKIGLCLPRMISRDFGGEAPEHHAVGIDDEPPLLDVARAWRKTFSLVLTNEVGPAPHRCVMQPGSRQPAKAFFDRPLR